MSNPNKNSNLKYLLKNTQFRTGTVCITIVFIIALNSFILDSPLLMDISNRLLPALSPDHLLGTDQFGRDILSRISRGIQISFFIGILASLISLVMGLVIGISAGYFGKWVDSILMRFVDIIQGFPVLLILIALAAAFPPSNTVTILAIGGVSWTGMARIVRGQILQIKTKHYIQAVRSMGFSHFRIILNHILPNCITTIIIVFTLGISGAIMFEASLSFLGMGIQPPEPSLGRMITEGKDFLRIAPHISIIPGLAIALIVIGFNLVGEGIRDVLDVHI